MAMNSQDMTKQHFNQTASDYNNSEDGNLWSRCMLLSMKFKSHKAQRLWMSDAEMETSSRCFPMENMNFLEKIYNAVLK